MKWIRNVVIIISPLLLMALLAFGLYLARTETSASESPTGDYYIKMYWTDAGGWGWIGKVYLVKDELIDKRYWTGWYVPASCEWISDDAFTLIGPDERETFQIEDIIHD